MDKILIVEDESIVALNLQQMLKRLGYDVVGVAHTAAEALALAGESHPDVVLMDINLGVGGDGIDTATRIEEHGRPAVIFLTAYSEAATLARAQEVQPYGYLLKPFSERDLHASLQMTLERHGFDRRLADSERQLRLALDCAGMGTWNFDMDTDRVACSSDTSAMVGGDQTIDEAWTNFLKRIAPEDRAAVSDAHDQAVLHGQPMSVEFRRVQEIGPPTWLRMQGRRQLEHGVPPRLFGVAQDVTARHRVEGELRQAAAVFEESNELIFIADASLRLLSVNPAFLRCTGHAVADVLGRRIDRWLVRSHPGEAALDLDVALSLHGAWTGELLALRRGGESFPAWLSLTALTETRFEEGRFVGILSDIGALRRAEAELIHFAHHDPLTGLPNRMLAMDRLEQAIVRARRNQWRIAVMMIDLDHLKRINDSLGHAAGDELLCTAAMRMKACVRKEDTVARLGGDEFVIILENFVRLGDISAIADKLLGSLLSPLTVCGAEVQASASIGISIFPTDAPDALALVRTADTAMYTAKQEGRHRYVFFKERLTDDVNHRSASLQDLRRGLVENELMVFYQPQVSLADMRLVGLEALVRWNHPKRGVLAADEVISVAEESGLIGEVGAYVLNAVCRQMRQWRDLGLVFPTVAVNISVQQLRVRSFATQVEALLNAWGVDPGSIELELTESTLQHEAVCMPAMKALEKLGVALAIDDFGTGYSSLGSLRHLPVGRCKIDRCFIDEIASHTSDAAITSAIIDLGHRLGMQITAEGVETEAQLDVLRKLGCDDVQGFLIARPMPASDMSALLEDQASLECRAPHYFHRSPSSPVFEPVPDPLPFSSIVAPVVDGSDDSLL